MKDLVEKGVTDVAKRFPGLFSEPDLRRLSQEILSGKRPYNQTLWRIVCFEAWSRVFNVVDD